MYLQLTKKKLKFENNLLDAETIQCWLKSGYWVETIKPYSVQVYIKTKKMTKFKKEKHRIR